jgi:ectoine hydroxylase-related dioxygenase (phytanoyl-CoA dioxygenase family)
MTMYLTPAHRQQFNEQGYCVLERAIDPANLASFHAECQRYIDIKNREMDELGTDTISISHRNNRYFIARHYHDSGFLKGFLFGDLMADITRSILGDSVYLFLELFVVKCAEGGADFAWHQDSGYMRGTPHKPYLTCWCALDDVNEENGTIYILPHKGGHQPVLPHEQDPVTNDLIGYRGTNPGIPIVVPAGSICVFSSTTLHRSGPNKTNKPRRVYLAEYSPEPITHKDSTKLWSLAVPFLRDGKRVVEEV